MQPHKLLWLLLLLVLGCTVLLFTKPSQEKNTISTDERYSIDVVETMIS